MKTAIILLLAVTLSLSSMDNIYVGIFGENQEPEYLTIEPNSLEYELNIPLKDGQVAYYFYNAGFGRLTNAEHDSSFREN